MYTDPTTSTTIVVLLILAIFVNLLLGLVSWWRCYANNYLHWGALVTWLFLATQGCLVYVMETKAHLPAVPMFLDAMVWYIVFIIFVMYCIMPMPFTWCVATCLVTSLGHTVVVAVVSHTTPGQQVRPTTPLTLHQAISLSSLLSLLLLYLGVNWLGLYTKYLTERAQRKAFLETRRSLETRFKTQKENERQEKLLLSVLPSFVAQQMIRDIALEEEKTHGEPPN